MGEALILLATNFLWGAYHAVQPGHGKTIAAAYIVGARGRPVDAWILGIFVTLSHTSGIVLVGVLASLGLPGFESKRIEVWLKVLTGVLIVAIGLWTLWTQRSLFAVARGGGAHAHSHEGAHAHSHEGADVHSHEGAHAHSHEGADVHSHQGAHVHSHEGAHAHSHEGAHTHEHTHAHERAHAHAHSHDGLPAHTHDHGGASHSHGFGIRHSHDVGAMMNKRPSLAMLIGLGIAGGLVPDPVALGLLIRALTDGQVMLGLIGVFVFSLGFAAVLVAVGVVAAAVGKRLLDWLTGPRAARLQIGMSLLIVAVGVILTVLAFGEMTQI